MPAWIFWTFFVLITVKNWCEELDSLLIISTTKLFLLTLNKLFFKRSKSPIPNRSPPSLCNHLLKIFSVKADESRMKSTYLQNQPKLFSHVMEISGVNLLILHGWIYRFWKSTSRKKRKFLCSSKLRINYKDKLRKIVFRYYLRQRKADYSGKGIVSYWKSFMIFQAKI